MIGPMPFFPIFDLPEQQTLHQNFSFKPGVLLFLNSFQVASNKLFFAPNKLPDYSFVHLSIGE